MSQSQSVLPYLLLHVDKKVNLRMHQLKKGRIDFAWRLCALRSWEVWHGCRIIVIQIPPPPHLLSREQGNDLNAWLSACLSAVMPIGTSSASVQDSKGVLIGASSRFRQFSFSRTMLVPGLRNCDAEELNFQIQSIASFQTLDIFKATCVQIGALSTRDTHARAL